MRYGEPAVINTVEDCGEFSVTPIFRGLEIWTYSGPSGLGGQRHYFFYRRTPQDKRRLWIVGTRGQRRSSCPGACYKSFRGPGRRLHRSRADLHLPERLRRLQDLERDQRAAGFPRRRGDGARPAAGSPEGAARGRRLDQAAFRQHDAIRTRRRSASKGPGSTTATTAAAASAAGSTPAPTRRKLSKKEIQELTEQQPAEVPRLPGARRPDHDRRRAAGLPADRRRLREGQVHRRVSGSAARSTRTACAPTSRPSTSSATRSRTEQFRNMNSDRAKIFLLNGPPDALITVDCADIYVPLQIWFYERLEALKSKVYLIFYQPVRRRGVPALAAARRRERPGRQRQPEPGGRCRGRSTSRAAPSGAPSGRR